MTLTYVSMHHDLIPLYHFNLLVTAWAMGDRAAGLQYGPMRGLQFGGLQCVLRMRKLQCVS